MKALTMKEIESETMKSAAIESKKHNLLIKKAKKKGTAYEAGQWLFTMNQLMTEVRNGRLTREMAEIYFEVNKEDILKRFEMVCRVRIAVSNK
jgi:hypothetical protein